MRSKLVWLFIYREKRVIHADRQRVVILLDIQFHWDRQI